MSRVTPAKRNARRPKRGAAAARAAAPRRSTDTAAPRDVAPPRAEPAATVGAPALPAALDIRAIQEAFEFVRSAVNCGVESIDASRVTSVDCAGLQLLLAAGRTAAAHGRALRWEGASSTLLEAAGKLGVAGLLGLARNG